MIYQILCVIILILFFTAIGYLFGKEKGFILGYNDAMDTVDEFRNSDLPIPKLRIEDV